MKTFSEYPNIVKAIGMMYVRTRGNDNVDDLEDSSLTALSKSVECPEEWVERCDKAETALQAIESLNLNDLIPENELEDFESTCDPTDEVFETLCIGEQSICDRLATAMDDGEVVREVLIAVYDGELTNLLEV